MILEIKVPMVHGSLHVRYDVMVGWPEPLRSFDSLHRAQCYLESDEGKEYADRENTRIVKITTWWTDKERTGFVTITEEMPVKSKEPWWWKDRHHDPIDE